MNASQVTANLAKYRTTPGILKAALIAIWVGAALLFVTALVSVAEHKTELTVIGKQAVPNIVNAQRIAAGLAEMDADAANELVGKPGENMNAVKGYEQRRQEVTRQLTLASEHITFGASERAQINVLSDGLTAYHGWITQARDFQVHGDAASVAAYRHATQLMHEVLLPAADQLDKVNSEGAQRMYHQEHAKATISLVLMGLCGLFVLGVLTFTQIFLSRRTNRTLNLGLLGSTAVATLFLLFALVMLVHSSSELSNARDNDYPIISSLWHERALAFDTKGQTSSWLFDRPLKANYEAVFAKGSKEVEALPLGDKFSDYVAVDATIRQQEAAGNHNKAVSLSIGKDPGEANYAFNQYDKAVTGKLDATQHSFDENIDSGLGDLSWFWLLNPVAALAIAILAFLGLRPRMREYNV